MSWIDVILSWARSFGIGGAFFIVTVGAFIICGMALWVVLIALKRGK